MNLMPATKSPVNTSTIGTNSSAENYSKVSPFFVGVA